MQGYKSRRQISVYCLKLEEQLLSPNTDTLVLTFSRLAADPRHGNGTTELELLPGPLLEYENGQPVNQGSIKNTIDILQ